MLLSMCVVIVEKGLFKHSCDQVIFRMPLPKKINITLAEVILIFFLNKINNNKHAEYHVIFIHSKIRDLLKTRQSCFSFVWDMDVSVIIFPYLGEAKVSTVNSYMTSFVQVNVWMKTFNELCIFNKTS